MWPHLERGSSQWTLQDAGALVRVGSRPVTSQAAVLGVGRESEGGTVRPSGQGRCKGLRRHAPEDPYFVLLKCHTTSSVPLWA